jgi:hypothetical protein
MDKKARFFLIFRSFYPLKFLYMWLYLIKYSKTWKVTIQEVGFHEVSLPI